MRRFVDGIAFAPSRRKKRIVSTLISADGAAADSPAAWASIEEPFPPLHAKGRGTRAPSGEPNSAINSLRWYHPVARHNDEGTNKGRSTRHSMNIMNYEFVFGVFGLAFLAFGIARRRAGITIPLGWLLILMAMLNLYVLSRSPLKGTQFWETSTILAVLFGATYSYLFIGLSSYLGVARWQSAVRTSLLPLVYWGLAAIAIVSYKAEKLENPALALFLFVILLSAIHSACYASIMFSLSRMGKLPRVEAFGNSNRRDLDLAITGFGLIALSLVLVQVRSRADITLFLLNVLSLGIFCTPLIVVRRISLRVIGTP